MTPRASTWQRRLRCCQAPRTGGEVAVRYEASTAEHYAQSHAGHFRTVTCLEMLEHVTDYGETIKACADLAQPGGDLFFSTINRNPKAYVLLILGAEYVLNMLPRAPMSTASSSNRRS